MGRWSFVPSAKFRREKESINRSMHRAKPTHTKASLVQCRSLEWLLDGFLINQPSSSCVRASPDVRSAALLASSQGRLADAGSPKVPTKYTPPPDSPILTHPVPRTHTQPHNPPNPTHHTQLSNPPSSTHTHRGRSPPAARPLAPRQPFQPHASRCCLAASARPPPFSSPAASWPCSAA